jgi:hypothetical protein
VGKQANVTDNHEGTETAPDSVRRIIADLEVIERRLGELLAARDAPASDASGKARALLRSAIEALTPAAPPETSEEAGTAKRRVKIKAESEIAAPASGERAGTAAKSPAKSPSRGSRSAAARRSANTDKASPGLLARLGAAAEAPPVEQAPAVDLPAGPAVPVKTEDTLKATADRLAQLEAEIADLTEAATAVPTRPAATAPSSRRGPGPDHLEEAQSAAAPSADQARQTDVEAGDGENAEITIVGADRAPVARAGRSAREAPRIFKDGAMPDEEEAEVEIKGDGASSLRHRGTDRAGNGRDSTRRSDRRGQGVSIGKWRIFRGST